MQNLPPLLGVTFHHPLISLISWDTSLIDRNLLRVVLAIKTRELLIFTIFKFP